MNRRKFLYSSSLAATLVGVVGVANAGQVKHAGGVERYVLVDDQNPGSVAFSRQAVGNSYLPISRGEDLGQFWFWTFSDLLQTRAVELIGISDSSDYFLLSVLAADAGMKLNCKNEHACGKHRLAIPSRSRYEMRSNDVYDPEVWFRELKNGRPPMHPAQSAKGAMLASNVQPAKVDDGYWVSWSFSSNLG